MECGKEGGGAVEVERVGCDGLGDAGEVAEDCVMTVERAETDGGVALGPQLTAGAALELLVVAAERVAGEGHPAAGGSVGCGSGA